VGRGQAGGQGGREESLAREAGEFRVEALLAMLRLVPDAIGVVEPDGSIRRGPNGFLGYTADELAGRFALDLLHPDDVGEASVRMLDAMADPAPTPPLRARVAHADGSWRWFEMTSINMVDDPDVGGLVFIGRDVTALKEAEDKAARAERWWSNLGRSATERVTILDRDGHVVFTTSDGQNLGYDGWGAKEMAGSIVDILHPDDLAAVAAQFADMVAAPGLGTPMLVRLKAADGRWLWIEVLPNNQLDNPDVGGLIITTRDVTEREVAMERLRDETRMLERLHTVGQRLAAELDLDTLLQEVADAATDVTGAAFGAFFHRAVGPDGEPYVVYAVSGATKDAAAKFPQRAPVLFYPPFEGQGIVRVDDVTQDPRFDPSDPNPLGTRSFLGVPVMSHRGEVHGALFFVHPEPHAFSERAERLAVGIAAHAAIAIDNAHLYQAAQKELQARKAAQAQLVHQAAHDPLTGLPNRLLVRDRLEQALAHQTRSGGAVAVLMLDLDRYKVVNDSLGHAAGDLVLMEVAHRLGTVVQPGDTVARLGGDEFVLVCENLNGELDAVGIADRIASAFTEPFSVGVADLTVTAAIGIAMATDHSTSDADSLLRDSDAVMHRAKGRGGNRWEIFETGLRESIVERLRVETALRQGLDGQEIVMHLQPIIDLSDGRVVGAEGLARWVQTDGSIVMPDAFIPVAEESGLVVPLGDQMLHHGCRQLSSWADDATTSDRTLSVNVSALQLVHGDLTGAVHRALGLTGADPRQLSLEITETALMGDVDAAGAVLRGLRALGVHLWVDDFGTGYSSLVYLRRLPLDGLKIDRSFVAGLEHVEEDRVLVAGIINLAHSLGLVALAEGVETEAQAATLRDLGCDLAQGYLWSPAAPSI
jgi:diguanylate cyclase (GGDEF)-like protein/PAS domain S-box-containing protein